MIRRNAGFTLVELLVVMGILGLVLGVTSDLFISMLKGYKQQGKIAETNIEGIIGLELLRGDIERAGYGLPWQVPVTYQEALGSYASYNDAPSNPPRPIFSDNNYSSGLPNYGLAISTSNNFKYSDLLVIKATNIASSTTSQLWTYMTTSSSGVVTAMTWTPSTENLNNTDYAIVLNPGTGNFDTRKLVPINNSQAAGQFGTLVSTMSMASLPPQGVVAFVYGITDGSLASPPPRMPFNRADYYITTSGVEVPQRCAPNTGVLVKSVIGLGQNDGLRGNFLPLLDCVADMKVIFRLDTDGDGVIDSVSDNISTLSAQQIRQQVKEVRAYILAHEGQKDSSFTYPSSTIHVGDSSIDAGLGHDFLIGTNVNYRWKVYTIVVQPKNMQQPLGTQ